LGSVFGTEMFYGPPIEMEDTVRACLSEGQFDPSKFGAAAMKQVMPLWMLKYLPNMPACHIGIALNAHGPNNSLLLGDVSGPAAAIEAASCIERGIAKLMVAGATGTRISTTRMNYRGDLPIPDAYDPPEFSSRPHDPTSKGVVGGEGAATLILETSEHAAQRDIKPIARIVSYVSRFVPSQGMHRGRRSNISNDQGARGSSKAIRLAIETALGDAALTADQIGLIVSHATGDPIGDAAEREAVSGTLANTPMVAAMASIGHTGAASGMMGLLTGALSLAKGIVPPTLHADAIRPKANFGRSPAPLKGDHVLCLSHTPEGNAIAIVLGSA
jgi:3-oxoacyl-[acyl-carrier-protein] synthase II